MTAIYQVKDNNNKIEYYSNLTIAKRVARKYLAERVAAKKVSAKGIIRYNERISYIRDCAALVLTATIIEKDYSVRVLRQNIKLPRVNNFWTFAEGAREFRHEMELAQGAN